MIDKNFLMFFNAHDEAVNFTVPGAEYSAAWIAQVDTAGALTDTDPFEAGSEVPVMGKSLMVLMAADPEVVESQPYSRSSAAVPPPKPAPVRARPESSH